MRFTWIDREKEALIDKNLKQNLAIFGKLNLFYNLSFIIKELVGNANKANLKRVCFLVNKLNINSKDDYISGIQKFKESISNNIEQYIEFIQNSDFNENYTKSSIITPINKAEHPESSLVAEVITKEIEDIPQFPEYIIKLQKFLDDSNSNFDDISKVINKDPALVADLLKISNSGLYVTNEKVNNINNAIRIIGYNGIQNLIKTYATLKILMNKYNLDIIKEIMDHSTEVAFYSLEITKIYKLTDIIDYVYTVTILHDIGKIIINSIRPELIKNIDNICNEKGLSVNLVENLTGGFNHSMVGTELAKKWDFPQIIMEAIKLHHNPWKTNNSNKEIVYAVYFSNILFYYKRNEIKYEYINKSVLDFFQISDKNKL